MACASMAMWMIVCLQLLLEITNLVLELLHLLFESLDALVGVGVLVTSLWLSHKSSLHSACYAASSDNSTIGACPFAPLMAQYPSVEIRASMGTSFILTEAID
jgi:hypothetical protein